MNNANLNRILQTAPVPELPRQYWEEFPERVIAEVQRRHRPGGADTLVRARERQARLSVLSAQWLLATAAGAACLVLAFWLGFSQARRSPATDPLLAEAQKCFREIEPLFPKQLQALVFDQKGTYLVLANEPDVPPSPPIYIKIAGPHGEHRFITFSGQRIRVNGDSFEVLSDRQGDVLMVGEQSVWSSSDPGADVGPYRIEARPLFKKS